MALYIGVDVGTGSVRAAAVECTEHSLKVVAQAEQAIITWNTQPDHYEQSSDNIWSAVCKCVHNLNVDPAKVKGVGFDATCSLVVLDNALNPLSVSLTDDNQRNVILWMDHRAKQEMDEINLTGHHLLSFVGGKISLEMEMPKILWMKRNLRKGFDKAGAFMDLPDYLTFKATGVNSRSLCSLVCKWAYDASAGSLTDHSWSNSFLEAIHLEELTGKGQQKIGDAVQAPGQPVGEGLSPRAAEALGLLPGTAVGTSLIDAHAGGVGMLTCSSKRLQNIPLTSKIGLICGTSTCHMLMSDKAIFVPGVWGPYYSAMIPGFWLSEGGQSATGKLIDHVIETHAAHVQLVELSTVEVINKYSLLANRAEKLAVTKGVHLQQLTTDLHIWPDHHGNRSPLADPELKGMISGLTLSATLDDLSVLYLATLQSLIYGTRHTIEAMEAKGHEIKVVIMCGGLTKNRLFIQMTSDILDRPVLVPEETESVLIGAASLGICAHQKVSLESLVSSLQCDGEVLLPDESAREFHSRKYKVFHRMVNDQMSYRQIMNK